MSGKGTGEASDSQELTSYRLKDLIKDVKGDLPGLKTGYAKLDKLIQIPRGALTIIAARTSHGKTALQLNLLANFLRDKDNKRQKFYFFSYEEARKVIATKLIMIMAGKTLKLTKNLNAYLNYLKYRSNKSHRKDPDIEKAIEEYNQLSSTNRLFISDEHFKVTDLVSCLDNLRKTGTVGAVFIDYIQKVPSDQTNPGGQRYQEIKQTLGAFP